MDWSREAIYTVTFFIFWVMLMLSARITPDAGHIAGSIVNRARARSGRGRTGRGADILKWGEAIRQRDAWRCKEPGKKGDEP